MLALLLNALLAIKAVAILFSVATVLIAQRLCWKFWTGWNNSMHVGWTQGGAVYILGSLGCIWLACIRRKTGRSALAYILLLAQLPEVTRGGIAWWNHEANAEWPIASSLLAAFIVFLILWEECSARKAPKVTAFEEKRFEPDDNP